MKSTKYTSHITTGFTHHKKNGVVYFTVPSIENTTHYLHGFSSRIGGVSPGAYNSLNLSLTRESARENVQKNYERISSAIGVSKESLTACHYEHGTNVCLLKKEDMGAGITKENHLPFCDGVIVTSPNITAVTLHADCTPLFFADKKGTAAGVCHAGWKGTYGNIAKNMIRTLNLPSSDILVGIGPAILSCCFEVKNDVSSLFLERYGNTSVKERDGKLFVDLLAVTLLQLEEAGIPPENVTVSDLCTYCREDLFYSHRRDHGNTGAMASIIALNP